ncbi:MAG: ATP-binding protein, partial [Rhizobacter sp.]
LHAGAIDLPYLVLSVLDIVRVRARHKGIAVDFVAADDLPRWVQGDAQRLRQVLLNLLGNAVKFTEQGHVRLQVSGRELDDGRYRLAFDLEDTGVGIPAAQIESIFEPFEQAGDAAQRAGGTGLGLAISRELIRAMGGDIRVRSEPGQGSVFSFDVVLERLAGEPAGVRGEVAIAGYEGPRRKLLVVDDVPDNRALLADVLGRLGFEIAQAVNGQDGLAQAIATRPDLILMDTVMPIVDGLQAIRNLRQTPGLEAVPIISLSASATPADEAMCLQVGANAFVPKPIMLDRLLAHVGRLLGLRWVGVDRPAAAQAPEPGEPLVPPPADELEVLYRLALIGNMNDVIRRAEHVAGLDVRYGAFAQRLAGLAKGFESRAVLRLVEQFRKSSSAGS